MSSNQSGSYEAILSECSFDLVYLLTHAEPQNFWLCDGSRDRLTSGPKRNVLYYGSAAVNAVDTWKSSTSFGYVPESLKLKFGVTEAELMAIYCGLRAAYNAPRRQVIIIGDDHSRGHVVMKEITKTWTRREINEGRYEYRMAIISQIRVYCYWLLHLPQVECIVLTTRRQLNYIRPELIKEIRDPMRKGEGVNWLPHWLSASVRRYSAKSEEHQYGFFEEREIYDWVKVLSSTSWYVIDHQFHTTPKGPIDGWILKTPLPPRSTRFEL